MIRLGSKSSALHLKMVRIFSKSLFPFLDLKVGEVLLEPGPGQQWTEDEFSLAQVISQQVIQQVETLRLLDEALRSRKEAELALHRLAHLNNRSTEGKRGITRSLRNLISQASQETGQVFSYSSPGLESHLFEHSEQPQADSSLLTMPFSTNAGVSGQVQIEGQNSWSQDDVSLLETVLLRLSQQVGNLQLLEESEAFSARD